MKPNRTSRLYHIIICSYRQRRHQHLLRLHRRRRNPERNRIQGNESYQQSMKKYVVVGCWEGIFCAISWYQSLSQENWEGGHGGNGLLLYRFIFHVHNSSTDIDISQGLFSFWCPLSWQARTKRWWINPGLCNNNKIKTLKASSKSNDSAGDEQEQRHKFFVHTKHGCGSCFQLPIIGPRFASSVHPDLSLCVRCFEKYTGPDFGLKKVAPGMS